MVKIGILALALGFGVLGCASKQKTEETKPDQVEEGPEKGDPDPSGEDQQNPEEEEAEPAAEPDAPQALGEPATEPSSAP